MFVQLVEVVWIDLIYNVSRAHLETKYKILSGVNWIKCQSELELITGLPLTQSYSLTPSVICFNWSLNVFPN